METRKFRMNNKLLFDVITRQAGNERSQDKMGVPILPKGKKDTF